MADPSASKRAVIVGLLGIGCYPLSWLGAFFGVRAFLAAREPGAPGRTLAIVAMLMPGLLLPVVALERAVLREPLQRWSAGRAQAECVENLPKLWEAEVQSLAHNNAYSEDKELLGFKPPRAQRYTYLVGTTVWTVNDTAAVSDHIKIAEQLQISTGAGGKHADVACITRDGKWVDVWTISSDDRRQPDGGTLVPGGNLINEFSGVLEPRDGG